MSFGEVFRVPTDSAYCQAKQKVKPEIFVHLTEQLNEDYYRLYGADEEVKVWRGHRLIGGDGTKLNLPDTPDLRASFGVQRNQTSGEQGGCVQATAVVAYDLLNDIGLQSALGKAHKQLAESNESYRKLPKLCLINYLADFKMPENIFLPA